MRYYVSRARNRARDIVCEQWLSLLTSRGFACSLGTSRPGCRSGEGGVGLTSGTAPGVQVLLLHGAWTRGQAIAC